ncbi:class I SAM-dependent methyltransferase [Dactylosporangium roseum]|uniref:Class I SAM-dependent methyltransferase n=1 Tax=Dactylosporangium roseum TaxID=47989 RepID=A0ABY5YZE4_9ACTN|nr:class I SAM-dependent methyltransferase [Dactylosporangium roseum]UWZ34759.1 class I SAM-dependent methyltransferase [Dactylosporangium roseum]
MTRERYQAWEWDTAEGMQLRLAGFLPRPVYLSDRQRRVDWVADRLALNADSEVLEVGSGEGVMAAALASRIRMICCADVSKSFLDKARETCSDHANVTYHLIDDDYLETLPSASFDAGYSLNVFIHLDAYEIFQYFRELSRVLRPGGRFVMNFLELGEVTWPFFRGDLARYRQAQAVEAKGMVSWHHRVTVAALAREAGLEPLPESLEDEGGVVYLTLRRTPTA